MATTTKAETIEIAASRERCLAVLLDFENYPTWSESIQEVRILERNGDGLGVRVAFALDMKIKTVRYTLAYTFDLPEGFSWQLEEGDLAAADGSYALREDTAGRTIATCEQSVDPGFWIPGPLRRLAESTALRSSLEELRSAAESFE